MERITSKRLYDLADQINQRNGKQALYDESGRFIGYPKGYIQIYGAYGAWAVDEIAQDGGTGINRLFELDTIKACYAYLLGIRGR